MRMLRFAMLTMVLVGIAIAGSNTLVEVDGGRVLTSHVNQYSMALKQDLLPRDATGVVADEGGSLGSSTVRWLNLYVETLNFGQVGNFLTVDENGFPTGSIDRAALGALGQQVSSSSGSFNTNSTSYTDVTNLSITITTTGKPVKFMLQPEGGATVGSIDVEDDDQAFVQVLRDGTPVYSTFFGTRTPNGELAYPPSSVVNGMDFDVTAGTYTYKVQAKTGAAATTVTFTSVVLVAYEK